VSVSIGTAPPICYNARMRVIMVTNMLPHPADPSFGTFISEQVRALRADGVEVDVLFVNGRKSRWNYLLGYPRFWARLLRRKYDLVHAHYVFSGWIARAQQGLPVIQSFHGPGTLDTWQGKLCRALVPLVDAVIVTSPDHRTRLGHPAAHVIPCGVDLELFAPMELQAARRALGWPLDRRVMTWIGDPRPEKRVDLVRATHERLLPRHPDLDLRIVTKVAHREVPLYLSAADVMVLTSDSEGSPVVIKEAMACNCPIVSTPVGDVPEILDGVEGCFIRSQSPVELAEGVEQALAFGCRTRGRDRIQSYGLAEEAQQLHALYTEILARRVRRRALVA